MGTAATLNREINDKFKKLRKDNSRKFSFIRQIRNIGKRPIMDEANLNSIAPISVTPILAIGKLLPHTRARINAANKPIIFFF